MLSTSTQHSLPTQPVQESVLSPLKLVEVYSSLWTCINSLQTPLSSSCEVSDLAHVLKMYVGLRSLWANLI